MEDDALREYRKKHCDIQVEKNRYGDFPNEAVLRVAHNGRQYSCISLSKEEAEIAIKLLKKHFSI